jgi:hypothetical protein
VSYTYDRLWEQKLSQVYRLLIPISTVVSTEHPTTELIEEDAAYENSSHIYESILGSAEGE